MDELNENVTINKPLIEKWLKAKHCTLWMDWDIVSTEGFNKASDWMLKQIHDIALFATEHHD
jgi:hypothetical protein